MNRAALIFALLMAMAGCSGIEQSNVEPQIVDACDAMIDEPGFNNLSFTKCLQNRADKSRLEVDAKMAQLLEVSRALETLERSEENSLVEPFENTQKAWVDYVPIAALLKEERLLEAQERGRSSLRADMK